MLTYPNTISNSSNNHAAFIWKIADTHLRNYYKANDYGKIILPFTILARLDSVLEPYKQAILEVYADREDPDSANISISDHYALIDAANDPNAVDQHQFYNTSPYTLKDVNMAGEVHSRLMSVINGFSAEIRPIFDAFKFESHIDYLEEEGKLLEIVQTFINADLSPSKVSNMEMGLIFEELIRRFAEDSAADNGEYFTPREVIDLAARLVITPEEDAIKSLSAPLRSVYDPTAGTGGMLSVTEEYIKALNPNASVDLYGQELNPESHAICLSDMILKGQDIGSVKKGNTLSNDQFPDFKFDYCLSNPPYGTDWSESKVYNAVIAESKDENGRFQAGVPKKSDGQLLFLQHVVSKLRDPEPGQRGGRAAVVMNGSSLFTGDAGSGESEIRRWMFEHDFVDTIVALPVNMFYSTGITTYIWIIDKDKPAERKGKALLIDASKEFEKMRKNLGMKSNRLSDLNLSNIIDSYLRFETSDDIVPSKIFANEEFGYRSVVVEHPLKARYSWNPVTAETLTSSEKLVKASADRQTEITLVIEEVFSAVETHVNSRQELDALLDATSKTIKVKNLTKAEKDFIAVSLVDATAGVGLVSVDSKGKVMPDVAQRETETIPLVDDVEEYLDREVRSYDADAWIDDSKTKIGYEVLFNRYFYKKETGRTLDMIETELEAKIAAIAELLGLHVIESDGSMVKPADISEAVSFDEDEQED